MKNMKKTILYFGIIFFCFSFFISCLDYDDLMGTFESDKNTEYAYNSEWADNIIEGTSDNSEIKKITIEGQRASVFITTADIENIQYKIEGLPDFAITVKLKGNNFYIIEHDLRRRNKYSRSWENIIAHIEVVLPKKNLLDEVNVNSGTDNLQIQNIKSKRIKIRGGVSSSQIENIECEYFSFDAGIDNSMLNNIFCKKFKLDCSTGDIEIENLQVKDIAVIDASTGELSIKNSYFNNPDIDLTGRFNFDGFFAGDVILNSGINKTVINLNNSNKINSFRHHGSTGEININNFECKNLDVDLSTGNTFYKNVKAEIAKIETSTALSVFENCELKNSYFDLSTGKIKFSGLLKGETEIHPSTGSVNFLILDSEKNYFVEVIDDSSPKFNINILGGNTYGEKNAKNKISIYKSNCKFDLNFKK